jgi:hypothetical protein
MKDTSHIEGLLREKLNRIATGPLPMYKTMFRLARTYEQSGHLVFSHGETNRNADFAAPGIMCYSFAIEILLKLFLVLDFPTATSKQELKQSGINLDGHSFSILYDRIRTGYQHEIADSFSKLTTQKASPELFREKLIELGDQPFVEWRYVYEKSSFRFMDRPLLEFVTHSLGKTAEVHMKRLE